MGDERAEQFRAAAVEAGLDDDVADFLALAGRGATATYQATYPGPEEGTELVVANQPPDRRIDVLADDRIVEVRLVLDGEAFSCPRDEATDAIESCERTDALVEGPGMLDENAVTTLTDSLADRRADFDFEVRTEAIAGVEANCLVTRLRDGRDDPQLGSGGTLCVSDEGVLLRVEQGEESLEATDYSTEIPDNTFVRPDLQGDD